MSLTDKMRPVAFRFAALALFSVGFWSLPGFRPETASLPPHRLADPQMFGRYLEAKLERFLPNRATDLEKTENLVAVAKILRRSGRIEPRSIPDLARAIVSASSRYGLDTRLVLAVIRTESNFFPHAVSDRGAMGLMQLLPSTAASLARELNLSYDGSGNLYDPVKNVQLGIYYLNKLAKRYQNWNDALLAYNMGPTRLSTLRSTHQGVPDQFVRTVQRYYALLLREI
jgi:soluble lytic murein transglycosylase-like protein